MRGGMIPAGRESMDHDLAPEHVRMRSFVRDFAEAEVAPVCEIYDREARFPYELVAKMGDLGLMGVPFPKEYGGLGRDTLAYAIAVEELARVDSSTAITMAAHTSVGTGPIWYFGDEAQKAEWMPRLASGRNLAALALTEKMAGSDVYGVETTARREGVEWVIDGHKGPITNPSTDITGVVIVVAQTGAQADGKKRLSCLLVPNGTPSFTSGPPYTKIGWRGSNTDRLHFAGCRVSAANLLGAEGAGIRQVLQTLDGGRISVSAMGVGLAQGAYELALAYSRKRVQFGQPIGRFQAIAFTLADMAARLEGARLLLYKAARLKDAGRDYRAAAAVTKLVSGELAVWAADRALQIHGGQGFFDETPISRFYRDAKVLTIGEGTSEIMRLVISRAIGAGEPAEGERDRQGPAQEQRSPHV